MNALTEAGVLVEDKLFATLDTRTRRWRFGGGGYALLSDTVGFIRDLPHALVASFKATLEEARQADLLLHVVDASSPEAEAQIQAVKAVLAELGLEDHPTLLVLNKTDQVPDRSYLDVLEAHHAALGRHQCRPGRGARSPGRGGSRRARRAIARCRVETGVANGRVLAYLAQHGQIRDRVYSDDDRVRLSCRLPDALPRVPAAKTASTCAPTAASGSARRRNR